MAAPTGRCEECGKRRANPVYRGNRLVCPECAGKLAAEAAVCPFCDYAGPSEILADYYEGTVFVIEPIDPVVAGHVLVIPRWHVPSFADWTTGSELAAVAATFSAAGAYAHVLGECNLITSRGRAATQTVDHFHVHLVPRREGDGLALPWT